MPQQARSLSSPILNLRDRPRAGARAAGARTFADAGR